MEEKLRAIECLGEPCRNFCIFASATILDPRDGKEKYVLSNYSDGGIGFVVIIDPETGGHETFPLPGDEGAWAVLNYKNKNLLAGTCSNFGYIHALDLKSRSWLPSVRDPAERYVWNFAMGSDGLVYGGTWPGCALLQYNPETQTLRNLGKASVYEENMYCRPVFGEAAGYILMNCGYEKPHAAVYDIASGEIRMLGEPGWHIREVTAETVCLESESGLRYYDAKCLEPMEPPVAAETAKPASWMDNGVKCVAALPGGKTAGVRGQEYFVTDTPDTVPQFKRIPGEAPATTIMTITAGPDGAIWGSTALGQTIFRYDPATGESWNSPQVCNNGGEVYGMRFIGGKLFLAAYVGGDHIVYDPSEPWDQFNNVNPRTLESVAPQLIRPTGKSVTGPDGAFWTGWSAKYGAYGGGLSRVDPETLRMRYWYDPVPGQQVAGLACDERRLYFTTNGEASGCDTKSEPFHLCVWDPETERIVWKREFEPGEIPGVAAVAGDTLLVAVNTKILFYNTADMSVLREVETGAFCRCLIALHDGLAAAFCGNSLFILRVSDGACRRVASLPGRIEMAVLALAGETLYITCNSRLYRLAEAPSAAFAHGA